MSIERARKAARQVIDANRKYALGHPSRRAIYVDAADEAYDIVEAVAPIILEGTKEALCIAREYVEASELRRSRVDLSIIDAILKALGEEA